MPPLVSGAKGLGKALQSKKGARTKARIGNITAIAMIGFAVVLDFLQFLFSFFHILPIVGNALALIVCWFITIFAFISFGIWFAFCGVNYFTGKQVGLKLLTVFSSLVVELVPIIDAIPAIIAGVVGMIIISRIEDFAGDEGNLRTVVAQRGGATIASSVLSGRAPREGASRQNAPQELQNRLGGLRNKTGKYALEFQQPELYGRGPDREAFFRTQNEKRKALSLVRGRSLPESVTEEPNKEIPSEGSEAA